MKITKYSCYSHVGKERANQEDYYLIRGDLGVFAVADGMGGHYYGEIASKVAIQKLNEIASIGFAVASLVFEDPYYDLKKKLIIKNMLNTMEKTLDLLNSAVRAKGRDLQVTMGSTISFLCFVKDLVFVGHSGDSVIYRFRRGSLQRMTSEHKQGPYLVGGLGITKDVVGEVHQHSRQEGDLYLLCSDGVTLHLSDDEICNIIATKPQQDRLLLPYTLTDLCLERGGHDNITAMVVMDEGSSPLPCSQGFTTKYGGPFR